MQWRKWEQRRLQPSLVSEGGLCMAMPVVYLNNIFLETADVVRIPAFNLRGGEVAIPAM